MTAENLVTLVSITFGLLSSGLALWAKSKQTKLETSATNLATIAKAKVDETVAVLDAWKEVSRTKDVLLATQSAEFTAEKLRMETAFTAEKQRLEAALATERTQKDQCSRQAARMEGQLAAYLNPAQFSLPPSPTTAAPQDMHIEQATVDHITVKSPGDDKK